MKILHISTTDFGGAGLCCIRIHESLLKKGIQSKVLVMRKSSNVSGVYKYDSIGNYLYRFVSKILRKFHLQVTDYNKIIYLAKQHNSVYSLPTSFATVEKNELIRWADVIHIHWINNYVNYNSFFGGVDKPIVWTLHDENLFYGIAHHNKSILKDNELEIKFYNYKYNAIRKALNLNIVFLSKMMYQKFGDEDIIEGRQKTIINNSVDTTLFFPLEKTKLRKKYNLDIESIFLLFIANDICDPNKGLDLLSKAVQDMNLPQLKILAIGGNLQKKNWNNVISLGLVKDTSVLNELISCSDYFVLPSFQEAFPQSPLEAMACGLPVVAFPVSGMDEMINDNNGIRCDDFSVSCLIDSIRKMLNKSYDHYSIRSFVETHFSPDAIADKYIDYYKESLKHAYGRKTQI